MSSTPSSDTAATEQLPDGVSSYRPFSPISMYTRDGTTDRQIAAEVISANVYLRHGLHIRPGDTVVDVGGHIGSFTLLALSHQAGRIYTYEPVSTNYAMLQLNVKRNQANPGQVRLLQAGVLAKSGPHRIAVRTGNYGGSNFYQKGAINEIIECVTLQNEFDLNDIARCNFLKLDCEDSELEILESFPYLDRVDQIALEFVSAERGEALHRILKDAGFWLVQEGPHGNRIGFIWASRLRKAP